LNAVSEAWGDKFVVSVLEFSIAELGETGNALIAVMPMEDASIRALNCILSVIDIDILM
jgi:hypothetical protein